MPNRNAISERDRAPWEPLAYVLWRRKHLTWEQIARHLNWEGWNVGAWEVEDAVMSRVQEELQRSFGKRRSGPGGPR